MRTLDSLGCRLLIIFTTKIQNSARAIRSLRHKGVACTLVEANRVERRAQMDLANVLRSRGSCSRVTGSKSVCPPSDGRTPALAVRNHECFAEAGVGTEDRDRAGAVALAGLIETRSDSFRWGIPAATA
jgi:hypothetical protein